MLRPHGIKNKHTCMTNTFEIRKLGEVAEFVNGRAFKPVEWDTRGLPIIRIQNLTGFSTQFNYFSGDFDNRYLVKRGDILISWSASLGVYIWTSGDAVLNQHIFKVNLRDNVDKTYFYYTVQTKLSEMVEETHGSTMKHITKDRFDNLTIPLPPLPIQKQIAAILEKADAAREKRRQANQLTEQFLQSAFLEMFGDPVTNPKEWEVVPFTDVIQEGPQNGLYRPAKDYGSGYPILRIDSFHYGSVHDISELKRVNIGEATAKLYLLAENDIVINRVNSIKFLGKSAIIPKLIEPTVFESNMMRITLKRDMANPRFLVEMLQQNLIRNQILKRAKDAVNQSSINQEDVKSFKFPLPPVSEQQKFAALVEKVESLRTKQKESEKELENLFNSLMQKAFKGELVQ